MRYASSIRYGGQLIDALDVDYQAYKHLGLLCPNCKEPIFLQGMSQRSHPTKLVEVPAHFKHFAAKDPSLAKECEARVAKYDQRELERRAASARGQRLKLLQRWFWKLMETNPFLHSSVLERLENPDTTKLMEYDAVEGTLDKLNFELWVETTRARKAEVKQYLYKFFECKQNATYLEQMAKARLKAETTEQRNWFNKYISVLDNSMHHLICEQVLDYLMTKQARPVFHKIYLISLVEFCLWKKQGKKLLLTSQHCGEEIWAHAIVKITEVFWAEEFVKLQKQDAVCAKAQPELVPR